MSDSQLQFLENNSIDRWLVSRTEQTYGWSLDISDTVAFEDRTLGPSSDVIFVVYKVLSWGRMGNSRFQSTRVLHYEAKICFNYEKVNQRSQRRNDLL